MSPAPADRRARAGVVKTHHNPTPTAMKPTTTPHPWQQWPYTITHHYNPMTPLHHSDDNAI